MNRGRFLYRVFPIVILASLFAYILLLIRPEFYFHHQQAPFVWSTDFFLPFLLYPGGVSELIANFFFQFFKLPYLASLFFFILVLFLTWLIKSILDGILRRKANLLMALIPAILLSTLVNQYNFPLTVAVSLLLVSGLIRILQLSQRNSLLQTGIFSAGYLLVLYVSGSGFALLYSLLAALIILRSTNQASLLKTAWILALSLVLPRLASSYVFPLYTGRLYLDFMPDVMFLKAYYPPLAFHAFLLSIPLLVLLRFTSMHLQRVTAKSEPPLPPPLHLVFWLLILPGSLVLSHYSCFQPDARKIVASDYYASRGNDERCARMVSGLKEYSMTANLNYNLALVKSDRLTEGFFDFFQISGYMALQPDFDFASELSFISAEYYYELGFISEARHWALEALVFYPCSPRALKLLARVHLVCGEYEAARNCLDLLGKGIGHKKVIRELLPLVEDPDLLAKHAELSEKRKQIPMEKELNPYIQGRFLELLEADPGNKNAYESLLLFYLLDGQLESFEARLSAWENFFGDMPEIYQEALLLLGEAKGEDMQKQYRISESCLDKYRAFKEVQQKHSGQGTMARNVLYWEMGTTYLYYYSYVYPRIVIPELAEESYEEPPI